MSTILVTGGAGYIGSHTCLELLEAGYDVIVVDNLSNAADESLRRVAKLTGGAIRFYPTDVTDGAALARVFARHTIEAVVHFAGLKAVGESLARPLAYYRNNVAGTLTLCETMAAYGVKRLVFSSSATVYGVPDRVPTPEDAPLRAINPYGRTKLIAEELLRDVQAADPSWSIAILRYFNPVGAHESGRIGESPNGVPNNLMPYIAQVAVGKLPELRVFGDGYATRDGTGVRDYIHVVDLAKGHVKALEYVARGAGVEAFNLGTGRGYSVLEVVEAFRRASGKPIPYRIVEPRPGDAGEVYADPAKAKAALGWEAVRSLDQMCEDAWRWQSANPDGYAGGSAAAGSATGIAAGGEVPTGTGAAGNEADEARTSETFETAEAEASA